MADVRETLRTVRDASIKPSDHQIVQRFIDRGVTNVVSVACSITATMDAEWQDLAEAGRIRFIKATNEHSLVGLAAGIYLGSGEKTLVHMQNSGFTNSADGTVSFARVYKIPTLQLITWRGSSETDDSEPHQEIGNITEGLTNIIIGRKNVSGVRLPKGRGILRSVNRAVERVENGGIAAVRLSPDAFKKTYTLTLKERRRSTIDEYKEKLRKMEEDKGTPIEQVYTGDPMSRAEAMQTIVQKHPHAAIIFANGYNARQAQEDADRMGNFYNAGYMGGTLAIGYGMAISNRDIQVVVVDGDQNAQMSTMKDNLEANYPPNLHWYILDNGLGTSVGMSPSVLVNGYLPDWYYKLAHVIETIPDDPNQKFLPGRVNARGEYFNRQEALTLASELGPLPAHALIFRLWVQAQTQANILAKSTVVDQAIQRAYDVFQASQRPSTLS